MFLKFRNIDRKTPVWSLFLKETPHRCFPVNIAKFLRTRYLQNNSAKGDFWKDQIAQKQLLSFYNFLDCQIILLSQSWLSSPGAHLESCQTSKMELFVKRSLRFQSLTIFTKKLYLIWLGGFWMDLCSKENDLTIFQTKIPSFNKHIKAFFLKRYMT